MRSPLFVCAAAIALGIVVTTARAGIPMVPYTEDFTAGSSNWYDAAGAAPVGWVSDGGPFGSGDAYATTDFDFSNANENDFLILFRGQDEFMSSDDAFFGDWLSAGITEFSFWFRNSSPVPVTAIARFAGPANTPAVSAIEFAPVLPGEWTQIAFAIDESDPSIFPEGGPGTFEAAFMDIGHVQIGLQVPAGLAGAGTFTFDIDKVAVVPTPAAWMTLLVAGVRRRRKR